MHDSTVASYGRVYEKLEHSYLTTGTKTCVDSAFNIAGGPFLIKSSQLDPSGVQEYRVNRDATSVRQMSEWGMHQIKAKFPRMNDTLKYEIRGQRRIDLILMVRLYNHQCTTMGRNQILSTYMPLISPENKFFHYGISIDASANTLADSLTGNRGGNQNRRH
jgi:hypothetical protein